MLNPCTPRRAAGERGFTLIELLITVAVMAVALSLAAPLVGQQLAGWRVRSAAQGIVDGMGYARTEAIRRSSPVSFTLGAGNAGWTVAQVSPASTLQTRSAGETPNVTTSTAAGTWTLTFRANGLVDTSGTYLNQVTVSAASGLETRRIDVFGGGLIRVCDPAISNTADTRSCT
jgi:type IV fimbrial biogenesis protein FimT